MLIMISQKSRECLDMLFVFAECLFVRDRILRTVRQQPDLRRGRRASHIFKIDIGVAYYSHRLNAILSTIEKKKISTYFL